MDSGPPPAPTSGAGAKERPASPSPASRAAAYARRGWSVVPLHTPAAARCSCGRADCPAAGKHPRIPWQELMRRRASVDEVAAWWRRWPDANVGVVTGRVSGTVVVDVDPRHDGTASLDALAERFGALPATIVSRTGGGGAHLWLAAPGEPVPTAEIAPGVELKAEGGLVVAPPSLHPSGRRYRWEDGRAPDEIAAAALPGWVAALAHGVVPDAREPSARAPSPRTDAERQAFAGAWRRAGIELRAGDRYYLCPFHDDHHPSLHVDSEGCRWYCFGCGRGGGIARLRALLGDPAQPAPRARARGRIGDAEAVTIAGFEETHTVGESLFQDELLALCGGTRSFGGVELAAVAELVTLSAADGEVVEVRIEGLPVGRLRREDADRLRPVLVESADVHGTATCRALVRGGWDRGRGDVGAFGVVLFLP